MPSTKCTNNDRNDSPPSRACHILDSKRASTGQQTTNPRSSLGGRDRLHVEHGAEEVLDDASLALLPRGPDILDLLLGLLVGGVLGFLVALGVLGLELLVLVLLGGLVVCDLLLGLVAGLLDALRPDCCEEDDVSEALASGVDRSA